MTEIKNIISSLYPIPERERGGAREVPPFVINKYRRTTENKFLFFFIDLICRV